MLDTPFDAANSVASQSRMVTLTLTDCNILTHLLEAQIDLHYKPLHRIDSVILSDSPKLDQLLLNVKRVIRCHTKGDDQDCDRIRLTSIESKLISDLLIAVKNLRSYFGLRNDYIEYLETRLGVIPNE
jgi:hypothetical protein